MTTPALIQAWLDYIKLEEMTAAEVERGRGAGQRVFDEQLSIAGNKLIIEEPLRKQLKAAASHQTDFQLALSGPVLYRVQGKGATQRIKYLPLFTIDVTSILSGAHRKGGWDVTNFPFQPVVANLVRLGGFDEDEAERIIVSRGLLPFLEEILGQRCTSFQDFLNQLMPPDRSVRLQAKGYLLCAHLQPYNTHLKAQLRQLSKSISDSGGTLPESSPAQQYLYGRPAPVERNIFFYGLFPSQVPDAEQAIALKQAQTNPLTPVCGSPGTGKTELSLHRLAQLQVERAADLIFNEQDASHLSVMAAKNNSVLTRFRQRLGDVLPCLPGGNSTTIRQTVSVLRKRKDELNRTPFQLSDWESAKQRFIAQYQLVQASMEQARDDQQQRQQALNEIEELTPAIAAIDAQLAPLREELSALERETAARQTAATIPVEAYRAIRSGLENAWQALPREHDPVLKKGWDWLMVTNQTAIIRGLDRQIRPAVLATLATPHPFQMPVNLEQLSVARQQVSERLNQALLPQVEDQRIAELKRQIELLSLQRGLLDVQFEAAQATVERVPESDPYDDFYQVDSDAHTQLFESSRAFLEQELLRRKEAVMAALRTYGDALQGDEAALSEIQFNGEALFRELSLAFPVMTSTLQSLKNMRLGAGCVRQALIDEAGSLQVHQVFPLLALSQQALVAGDPYQVEPILNLCKGAIAEYRQATFTGELQDLYDTHSPTARYSATAYHRAAGADATGNGGAAIMLKTHYRSAPAIAQFCAPIYPEPLNIKASDRPSRLGANLLAYEVEGYYNQHMNPAEVSAIAAIVSDLLQHGYALGDEQQHPELSTIGILTPFHHQARALQEGMKKQKYPFPTGDISTVHNFQGAEKSVIIFSAYKCSAEDDFWFFNRAPNLLNTAVSRAKELFILVGNLTQLERAEGETQRLVEHIRQRGDIRPQPKP